MHDQSTRTPIERQNGLDSAILSMLICESDQRLWSVDEIAREVQKDPTDSLRRLSRRWSDSSPGGLRVADSRRRHGG